MKYVFILEEQFCHFIFNTLIQVKLADRLITIIIQFLIFSRSLQVCIYISEKSLFSFE